MIPIFIGGSGRSGTTVLKRVLSAHPSMVSITGELRVIIDPGGALSLLDALTDGWTPYAADDALWRFFGLMRACATQSPARRIAGWLLPALGISPPRYGACVIGRDFGTAYYRRRLGGLMDELVQHRSAGFWIGSPAYRRRPVILETAPRDPEATAAIIASFFHDLYGNLPGAKHATHWIDDTPFNILHAGALSTLFPDMHLVHIHRNPLDVVAAYRHQRWGGEDIAAVAGRVGNIYAKWTAERQRLAPDSFSEIGLEGLLDDPKGTLPALCGALGVDADERVLAAPALARDQAHVGRWRRDLSDDEAALCRQRLRPMMEAYGYQ